MANEIEEEEIPVTHELWLLKTKANDLHWCSIQKEDDEIPFAGRTTLRRYNIINQKTK